MVDISGATTVENDCEVRQMSKRTEKQKRDLTVTAKIGNFRKREVKEMGNIATCVICGEKFILAGAPVLTCGKRDCVLEALHIGLFEKDKKQRELKRQKELEKYEQAYR